MTTFAFAGATAAAATGNLIVPDVRGEERADAETKIRQAGFQPYANIVESKIPGDPNDGKVYLQDPSPPAVRPEGSIVTLHVVELAAPAVDLNARLNALEAAVKLIETEDNAKDRFDKLATAIAKAESDADAKKRYDEIIDRLNELEKGQSGGSSRAGRSSSTT